MLLVIVFMHWLGLQHRIKKRVRPTVQFTWCGLKVNKRSLCVFRTYSLGLCSHCGHISGLIARQVWPESTMAPDGWYVFALSLSLNGYSRRVISPWEVRPALLSLKAPPPSTPHHPHPPALPLHPPFCVFPLSLVILNVICEILLSNLDFIMCVTCRYPLWGLWHTWFP